MTDNGVFTIAGAPYWIIFLAACAIAFGRTQIIYWLGRGLAAGTLKTRLSRHLEGERAQRAITTVNRWGPIAVTLSFLTVGVQTVINLTAGYTRMPFWRYVAALVPGSMIWAAIWTTIGAVAFNAAVALAAMSPIGFAVITALLVGVGLWVWVAMRRRRRLDGRPAHPLREVGRLAVEDESSAPTEPTGSTPGTGPRP